MRVGGEDGASMPPACTLGQRFVRRLPGVVRPLATGCDPFGINLVLDSVTKLCDTLSTMKTATIRDLRYDFAKLEGWLRSGEEIQITKHNKPVATLLKAKPVKKTLPPQPDYEARLKRIWGDRVFSAKEVEEMRAFETGEP